MVVETPISLAVKGVFSNYFYEPERFGTHYHVNLYVGCGFGCMHCEAQGLYATKVAEACNLVAYKENGLALLKKAVAGKRRRGIVLMGAESDPYPEMESEKLWTREAIDILSEKGFGLVLVTRSSLVLRDLDRLVAASERVPVAVVLQLATTSDALSRALAPSAPLASERLGALAQLASAGVMTGVLMAPVLPFLTDDPEASVSLVAAAAAAGAHFFYTRWHTLFSPHQWRLLESQSAGSFTGLAKRCHEVFGEDLCVTGTDPGVLQRSIIKACEEKGLAYKATDIAAMIQREAKA